MTETLNLRTRTLIEEHTVEVEFPIYRAVHGDDSSTYTKQVRKDFAITVTADDSGEVREVEFERHSMEDDASPLDYQLGEGAYATSPERVESFLAAALDLIYSECRTDDP